MSALLVTGLRLGLPAEEDDLFERLAARGVVSHRMAETLRERYSFSCERRTG